MRAPATDRRAVSPARRTFVPILAPLLRERRWAWLTTALAGGHLVAANAGFSPWGCIIRDYSGVPCPGCGLTSAAVHFMQGEWRAGWLSHAFAPVFLAALLGVAAAAAGPPAWRERLAERVDRWERRTGGGTFFLVALLLYWAARLL